MVCDPSIIEQGQDALAEFLIPERISVNAMVQNKIQTMMRDSQDQEKLEAHAALRDLSHWLEIVLSRDVEEQGKLLRLTYDLPSDKWFRDASSLRDGETHKLKTQ